MEKLWHNYLVIIIICGVIGVLIYDPNPNPETDPENKRIIIVFDITAGRLTPKNFNILFKKVEERAPRHDGENTDDYVDKLIPGRGCKIREEFSTADITIDEATVAKVEVLRRAIKNEIFSKEFAPGDELKIFLLGDFELFREGTNNSGWLPSCNDYFCIPYLYFSADTERPATITKVHLPSTEGRDLDHFSDAQVKDICHGEQFIRHGRLEERLINTFCDWAHGIGCADYNILEEYVQASVDANRSPILQGITDIIKEYSPDKLIIYSDLEQFTGESSSRCRIGRAEGTFTPPCGGAVNNFKELLKSEYSNGTRAIDIVIDLLPTDTDRKDCLVETPCYDYENAWLDLINEIKNEEVDINCRIRRVTSSTSEYVSCQDPNSGDNKNDMVN